MARSFADANRFQRAMRTFASTPVGVFLFKPTGHVLDKAVAKVTKGKRTFGGLLTGVPVVLLTTTGAKSGQPRVVAVAGVPHGEGFGLIASNWGQTRHPAWYHNLKANPSCTIEIDGDSWEAEARLATPDERDQIWNAGLALYPGWRKYEARAGDRTIQAFVLTRA